MKLLCYAAALCLIAVPVTAAPAPLPKPPKNKAKIVGVWEPVHSGGPRPPRKVLWEFTKDGRLTLVAGEFGGEGKRRSASYSVDGDKLDLTIGTRSGRVRKLRHTITKLTATELQLRTEKGAMLEFKRKKM